jgi:hypothetical protein
VIPGQVPWHLDVQYIPAKRQYWALVAAYPNEMACNATALYFATSDDGTTWKASPYPLLAAGKVDAMRDVVYRSTFHYYPRSQAVSVWYSGARLVASRYHWSVASARYSLAELYRRVGEPGALASLRNRVPAPSMIVDHAAVEAFARNFP